MAMTSEACSGRSVFCSSAKISFACLAKPRIDPVGVKTCFIVRYSSNRAKGLRNHRSGHIELASSRCTHHDRASIQTMPGREDSMKRLMRWLAVLLVLGGLGAL